MTKQLGLDFGGSAPWPQSASKHNGFPQPRRYLEDPNPRAPRPFVGRFVELTSPRRCSVCGNTITDGRAVVFQDMAAHVGCGQVRT